MLIQGTNAILDGVYEKIKSSILVAPIKSSNEDENFLKPFVFISVDFLMCFRSPSF